MKTFTLFGTLLIISSTVISQIAPDKYFVSFTDKNNSPYSVDNPSAFLSQRAIERRQNQGIAVDITDIPVNTSYLQGVAATGASLLNPTKWLNGVTIYTDDPAVIEAIEALPYVSGVTKSPVMNFSGNDNSNNKIEKPFFQHETYNDPAPSNVKQGYEIGAFDYGSSLNQIKLINGDAFHEMGYRGQGMVIAVLDAGFLNANSLDVFDSLWNNDQILGTHDFVRGGEVQFDEHPHGSMVLSCMGGNYPGELIGTAPKASYWLLRSEDGASEYRIEEYNWVSGAEFADSVGADVINSSLGYSDGFTDPGQNHTYDEMDGNTTVITRGADMAAKKGILVVNSLGNEGLTTWYYLSAPSDGDSVMGIGAVDGDGNYAGFSSHGPSADGRVKPDVVAQGSGVYIIDPANEWFTYGGGTSFSSPILAGMAACLWQANPSLTNMQIADAIRQSASQYLAPDDFLGYGIPDFVLANDILTVINGPESASAFIDLYPNPFREEFLIDATKLFSAQPELKSGNVEIFDNTGRLIGAQSIQPGQGYSIVNILQHSPTGLYFVKLNLNGFQTAIKVIKN
jgi:subtilisin family serine protease